MMTNWMLGQSRRVAQLLLSHNHADAYRASIERIGQPLLRRRLVRWVLAADEQWRENDDGTWLG